VFRAHEVLLNQPVTPWTCQQLSWTSPKSLDLSCISTCNDVTWEEQRRRSTSSKGVSGFMDVSPILRNDYISTFSLWPSVQHCFYENYTLTNGRNIGNVDKSRIWKNCDEIGRDLIENLPKISWLDQRMPRKLSFRLADTVGWEILRTKMYFFHCKANLLHETVAMFEERGKIQINSFLTLYDNPLAVLFYLLPIK
jgi:hypothetical protein